MTVREYLHSAGMTAETLQEILGHKTTSSITKKMDVEMPTRWERLLNSVDESSLTAVGEDDSTPPEFDARSQTFPNDPWDNDGRDNEGSPSKPTNADTVVGPQRIKLSTVEGYISQIYSGAAYLAKQRGDDIAADTINRYSPEFAQAWVNYIESDPRIMAYLEKLMIGTPLGNLIGVHVIAVGSYTFARVAARQISDAFAAESFNGNGSPNEAPADFVG